MHAPQRARPSPACARLRATFQPDTEQANEPYFVQWFFRRPCLPSGQELTCRWLQSRSHTPGNGTMSGAWAVIWPWDDAQTCYLPFNKKQNKKTTKTRGPTICLTFYSQNTSRSLTYSVHCLPRLLCQLVNLFLSLSHAHTHTGTHTHTHTHTPSSRHSASC